MNESNQHNIKMSNPKLAITTANTITNTITTAPNQMATIDDTTATTLTNEGNHWAGGSSAPLVACAQLVQTNTKADNCHSSVDGTASALATRSATLTLTNKHKKNILDNDSTLIQIDNCHQPNEQHLNGDTMNVSSNNNPSTVLTSSAISSTSQTNLVRKHSCGDLVSRLKSRKILGVGENSEHRGEVYRSKISQLLGHSEHLFTRFPVAFWHWYAFLILVNVLAGLWHLFGHLLWQPKEELSSRPDHLDDLLAIVTFYRQFSGILYLVFASILWRFYGINDKTLVRYILLICSLFSLVKIILILYYSHCNVVEAKNWLISFICPSKCAQQQSASDLVSSATSGSSQQCSHFSSWSSSIVPHFELVTYLVLDSSEMLVNLWYRHRMQHSASGSSSMLASSTMTATRRVSAHDGSICEYIAFLLHSYLIDPIARLLNCAPMSDNQSTTTPNMSAPTSPTTLKPPEDNIEEETVEDVANLEAQNATGNGDRSSDRGKPGDSGQQHSHQQ